MTERCEPGPDHQQGVVLVADDDPAILRLLGIALSDAGHRVVTAPDGRQCIEIVRSSPVDVVVLDLWLPDVNGLEVLAELRRIRPEVPILILTASATVETAIAAIQQGAHDYLAKPFNVEDILVHVERAVEQRRLVAQNLRFQRELKDRYRFENLVGASLPMVDVYRLVARAATTSASVLVQGETGTGKELIARAIHYGSARASGPFVPIDCTALPEGIVESELFGHQKGAFTGASTTKQGLFEVGSGGTVFLDEIGDLPLGVQSRLLRVLQEREVRRVGGNERIAVDVRVIAASNRDLGAMVKTGEFREDLYYRLSVIVIAVPPLRDRRDDVPWLVHHFIRRIASETGRAEVAVSQEAMDALTAYDWPGNVRQLENAVMRAVSLSSSPILTASDFSLPSAERSPAGARLPSDGMTLADVKRWYVEKVLRDVGDNKQRAAEILGLNRRTLYRLLARGGADDGEG